LRKIRNTDLIAKMKQARRRVELMRMVVEFVANRRVKQKGYHSEEGAGNEVQMGIRDTE
jgi:hypothetical protein